jgi:antirestriction protein ArdC
MRLEPPVGASGADKSWRTRSCMAIARTWFASVPELEAESVAYVGCRELGIDSSAYSFGYVNTWTGGGAEAQRAITKSAQRTQKAAHLILYDSGANDDEVAA